MRVYLAGMNGRRWIADDAVAKSGIYVLDSFFYADETLERQIPTFKDFMLDSGAFTFFSGSKNSKKGKPFNWEEYVDRYAAFINRHKVKKFFELDIDSLIGYERVIELRKRLIQKTGIQPIPVWHRSRGRDEFLKMCDEFKYVAVGGIVAKEIAPEEYPIFTYLIREAHKRRCLIHGLGFTNLKLLPVYRFDSVDSSTWTSGNRFGAVYVFNGKTLDRIVKKDGERMRSVRRLSVVNFEEWVKFQKYAEAML